MDEKLRTLLDDPRFREYHRGLKPEFSAFDVLRNADYEIRQSNVLAWLLQSSETHGVGSAFLEWFVAHVRERLRDGDAKPLPELGFEASSVGVWRERDYVDATLAFEREKCLIAIENKMSPATAAHVKQVRRYERELRIRYPGHAVRSVLLTTSPEGSFHAPGIANLSWTSVRDRIRALLERREGRRFRAPGVRAFIRQYLVLLARWLDPVESHAFRTLLDEHREILGQLRRVLGEGGNAAVIAKVREDREIYGETLLRLVKESGQRPMDLRRAVSAYLHGRGSTPMSSQNPAGTHYWLTWTDPDLAETAERLGGRRDTLRWALTFRHHGVWVGFFLQDPPGEAQREETLVDRLRAFVEATPINRQRPDDYSMEDRGFGGYRLYYTSLLPHDELFALSRSAARTEVIRRLEAFMESSESEYARIVDTFRCLAFRPEDPIATSEESA